MDFISLPEHVDRITAYLKRRETFSKSDLKIAVSPYRISPLGAHVDHQGGPVLGMTINARTILAFIPNREKKIRLYSMNYPGVVEFGIENIKTPRKDDWGRYAMGAAKVPGESMDIERGFTGALSGALPACGLSSSASVGLAYLRALAEVNGLSLSREEYVELDRRIENDYLRLENGILDQASIVYGKKDNLLHIDTRTGETTAHPKPEDCGDFKILIVYSGVPRELTSSGFNTRVEECRKAAGFLGIMAGLRAAGILSDVPERVFVEKSGKLPEDLRKRAAHYFTEAGRVKKGIEAWDGGDIEAFGKLMDESCESSFINYETGSPELETLQEILNSAGGVYGSRLNGGGYGGSLTAFVRRDFSEASAESILERYKSKYPESGESAAVYFAETDDGLRLL
ncbi:MAG: galactokinase family protein [Deltaproteobacteria bacterium]